jgi:hypothetical protein
MDRRGHRCKSASNLSGARDPAARLRPGNRVSPVKGLAPTRRRRFYFSRKARKNLTAWRALAAAVSRCSLKRLVEKRCTFVARRAWPSVSSFGRSRVLV